MDQLATQRQIDFIRSLLDERVVSTDVRDAISLAISMPETFTKRAASRAIDSLSSLPRRPRAAAAPARPNVLVELDLPKSRYAIPAIELATTPLDVTIPGELLFVEIKEYRGTVYMRRLIGAPGSFSRLRLSPADVSAIARVVAEDAYKYARLFGEHYICCGKCGAELTDDESRRLMLGPVCRRAFGV